jgi:hypothetical protein
MSLINVTNLTFAYDGSKVSGLRFWVKTAPENQVLSNLFEYSSTMLFVEHDSEFCKNIATKIIELQL